MIIVPESEAVLATSSALPSSPAILFLRDEPPPRLARRHIVNKQMYFRCSDRQPLNILSLCGRRHAACLLPDWLSRCAVCMMRSRGWSEV